MSRSIHGRLDGVVKLPEKDMACMSFSVGRDGASAAARPVSLLPLPSLFSLSLLPKRGRAAEAGIMAWQWHVPVYGVCVHPSYISDRSEMYC